MRTPSQFIIILSLVFISACTSTAKNPGLFDHWVNHITVNGEFEDVRSFVELAITDRGLKINHVSHIGKMLQRTASEVGDQTLIFKRAQALEFCSATVSRNMMKSNPHYIALCPYIIYVYELPQQTGIIHVAYRNPLVFDPKDQNLIAVDQLLNSILEEIKQ